MYNHPRLTSPTCTTTQCLPAQRPHENIHTATFTSQNIHTDHTHIHTEYTHIHTELTNTTYTHTHRTYTQPLSPHACPLQYQVPLLVAGSGLALRLSVCARVCERVCWGVHVCMSVCACVSIECVCACAPLMCTCAMQAHVYTFNMVQGKR